MQPAAGCYMWPGYVGAVFRGAGLLTKEGVAVFRLSVAPYEAGLPTTKMHVLCALLALINRFLCTQFCAVHMYIYRK